ncbi:MAG: septal ring lytic transglycosylase RlpA family protein [Stenomitos rutilans HA7619-LM2]|jgi:rare lipoprotein A|nr:septal ring lytic transglycosylase RlpA family protein [Stenomitos rutilans HA7619-LM2]
MSLMKKQRLHHLLLLITIASSICSYLAIAKAETQAEATATTTTTVAAKAKAEQAIRGLATWYGSEFSGSRTANGEMFNPNGLTAAHHSLPFGTQVRVTNVKNGRSVVVRINDRLGDPGVIIDLSMGAAKSIGLLETSPITMEVLRR